MAEKEDLSVVSYVLGIVSIVMAIFTPLAGIVFGIVGLSQSKKQKTKLSEKAKKLNIIGIILGIILFIVTIILAYTVENMGLLQNFPTG